MKKFIKGTLELDKNVTDLVAYEQRIKTQLKNLLNWGDRFNVGLTLGTADDNTYLCEYKIVASTKSMCNGLFRELKELLHEMFPYVKSLWQGRGDQLW